MTYQEVYRMVKEASMKKEAILMPVPIEVAMSMRILRHIKNRGKELSQRARIEQERKRREAIIKPLPQPPKMTMPELFPGSSNIRLGPHHEPSVFDAIRQGVNKLFFPKTTVTYHVNKPYIPGRLTTKQPTE